MLHARLTIVVAAVFCCFWLGSSAQPIVISRPNSTFIVASTLTNQLSLTNGTITMHWRYQNGTVRPGDYIRFTLASLRDYWRWKRFNTEDSCYDYTSGWYDHEPWEAWSSAGPNGTTIVGMNATYNGFCKSSVFFYLTNQPKTVQVGNISVPIDPRFLKLSVDLDCPWKQTLMGYNLGNALPSDPIYLYHRKSEIPVKVEFQFSSPFAGFPNVSQFLDPPSWPKLTDWLNSLCAGSLPDVQPDPVTNIYPFQPLAPNFDFFGESGLTLPSADITAGVYFLPWAISDVTKNYTRVSAEMDPNKIYPNSAKYYVGADILVAVVFQDSVSYDPSLHLVFDASDLGAGPSASTLDVVSPETIGIAAGVSVSVVAVAAVSLALVIFFRRKKQDELNRARVHNRINSVEQQERAAIGETTAKPNGWHAASPKPVI